MAERFVEGPSVRGRSAGVLVRCTLSRSARAENAASLLLQVFPDLRERAPTAPALPAVLAALADLFLGVVGMGAGPSSVAEVESPGIARLFLAAGRPDIAAVLLSGLERLANLAIETAPRAHARPRRAAAAASTLPTPASPARLSRELLESLVRTRDTQVEAARLYAAARGRGLPAAWLAWPSGCLVIGEGERRRLFHRATFDADAALTSLANDKLATSRLLEQAGIRTTHPVAAATAEEATAIAREIGYPVVLKPACGWAQVGVWLGLRGPREVRRAFERARAQAGPLLGPMLVERERSGLSVRVTLVGGEIAAAAASTPPVAAADGRASVLELARRAQGVEQDAALDARSAAILEAVASAQGLRVDDVPRRGRRVRIGLASQGRHRDVRASLPREAQEIARRIGALLPLPVLGLDLLIARRGPSGGRVVVVEVNPSPAFSLHERAAGSAGCDLSGSILDVLFPPGTRATVPVLAGPAGTRERLHAVAAVLLARSIVPSGYTSRHAWTGAPDRVVGEGAASAALVALHAATQVLLLEVDEALAASGLPVGHVDAWFAGPEREGPLVELLSVLAPGGRCDSVPDGQVAARLLALRS